MKVSSSIKYFLLGVLFWVIVDYTTVFNPDFTRWLAHMPLIWVYYLGVPLLFTYLIYRRKVHGKMLFLAAMLVGAILELLAFQNGLLFAYPLLIPLAMCIYTLITIVPYWIVEGKLKEKWGLTLVVTLGWLIVAFLHYMTEIST